MNERRRSWLIHYSRPDWHDLNLLIHLVAGGLTGFFFLPTLVVIILQWRNPVEWASEIFYQTTGAPEPLFMLLAGALLLPFVFLATQITLARKPWMEFSWLAFIAGIPLGAVTFLLVAGLPT